MVFVDLGRNTNTHVIALGDNSRESRFLVDTMHKSVLKPVELEGGFPSYFHVYVRPGQEIELRQVLEPANMAYLVDFCRAYRVELYHDQLFFAQVHGAAYSADPTPIIQDVQHFLTKNVRLLKRL